MKYIIALTAMILASCSSIQLRSGEEMLIAESVLRSLYGENASAEQSNKAGASLCVDGKDTASAFLLRFKGLYPTALPCSASQYNEKRGELVRRGTVEPMISFSVSEIKIISSTSATATGGYYEASLSSAEWSFKLTKVDGKWVVQERSMSWIS